jgi:hypothetical protein
VWLSPPGRPAHAVPGRAHDALSDVVTVQWPRARRWGGAAGPGAPADKVYRERQHKYRGGGGNMPDEVAVARAHPSNGLACGGGAEAARRCSTVAEPLR